MPKSPKNNDQRTPNMQYTFTVFWETGCLEMLSLNGQTATTLKALISSRGRGITALEVSSWAFRLSAYIHILRHKHQLDIATVREPHDTGWHGRYILNTKVIKNGKGS